MSPDLSPGSSEGYNKEGKDAKLSPLLQTTGLCLPFQTRIPSLPPQGENNHLLGTERDSRSMKQVGVGSFRNKQINKQMGAWKEEMVYE